jgi:hypothetical protein
MDTILTQKYVKRIGHFQLHSALVIGHKEFPGFQRVLSHPFKFTGKLFRGGNRKDPVCVRPPGVNKNFRLSIDAVWFCKVLLFFAFETETDTGIKRHECAFVSVLWEYNEK